MGKINGKRYLEQRIKETQKRFIRTNQIAYKRSKKRPPDRLFAELQLSCYTDLTELKMLLEIYEATYEDSLKNLRKKVEESADKLRISLDENWGNLLEKALCKN